MDKKKTREKTIEDYKRDLATCRKVKRMLAEHNTQLLAKVRRLSEGIWIRMPGNDDGRARQ
jgi:hypothetical protein